MATLGEVEKLRDLAIVLQVNPNEEKLCHEHERIKKI